MVEAIHKRDAVRALEVLRKRPELASMRRESALSPLMLALYNGLEDVARAIQPLAGQLNVFDAAAIGDVEQLRQLTTNDAIANAWSEDGFTPLHLAAFFGRAEAVRLLIDRGARLETPSRNEQFAGDARPLHSAVAAQQLEVTRILLERGADPNARQHGGFTPLLEAAQSGNGELVQLLLSYGANTDSRLDDGRSAADLAGTSPNPRIVDLLAGSGTS